MINPKAKLSDKVFKKDIDQKPTRDGYGHGLVEAGEKDEREQESSALQQF